jgi:hypothetical protein
VAREICRDDNAYSPTNASGVGCSFTNKKKANMAAASVKIICIDIIFCITFLALIELNTLLTAYPASIRNMILLAGLETKIKLHK